MEIVEQIYGVVNELPDTEKFGLRSQLSRAAVSIPSNIAEGGSRHSSKEYKRFLEIALGSCFELETQLMLLKRVSLVEEGKVDLILEAVVTEEKMISGLMSKIKQ